MMQGYLNADRSQSANQFVTTYRLRDMHIESVVDMFSWRLMDYLEGINTLRRKKMINFGFDPGYWGINIYDAFERYFDLLEDGVSILGSNSLYTFYEHKLHMRNKCRYYKEKHHIKYTDALDQQICMICDSVTRCVMLHTKINVKNGPNSEREINSMQRIIRELKEQEQEAYTELCRLNGWYVERG